MGFSFDGSNKIISCTSGTTDVDVRDLYSRWKQWAQSYPQFLPAFSIVGGETIDESSGVYVTTYAMLENGWKLRPQESNHKLRVWNGVLLSADGSDPFVQTIGNYNVLIVLSQPVKSETVSTGEGGGGDGGLTTSEHDKLMSLPTLAQMEGSSVLAKEATVGARPTLAQIEGSSVLARQASVAALPTLAQIEASTVIAKQDTVLAVPEAVGDVIDAMGLPTLSDIESSTALAKQADVLRALGLVQENQAIDNCSYTTQNGVNLLTGCRIRAYSSAASVGTDQNVIATYQVAASYQNGNMQSYTVIKQ